MYYSAKTAYRGKIASDYDEDRRAEPIWEVEQVFVRDWCATLPPGARVLDLPCGTGRFVPFYLDAKLAVTACDISADMVAELHRRYPDAAVAASVADAEQLAMADNAFDALVCWRFVHLVPEPILLRAFGEFRRVTRGPILVEVLQVASPGRLPWARAARNRLRTWWRRWFGGGGSQPWSHITSYSYAEDTLLGLFKRAGLRVEVRHELGVSADRPVIVYQLRRADAAT